jgi:hypothetical protein
MSISTERELTRRRYLDAMGITAYLARGTLPGAAPVQRLAVRQRESAALPPIVEPAPVVASAVAERPAAVPTRRVVAVADGGKPPPQLVTDHRRREPRDQTRFSLAVLFAGGLAWLEDLQGRALANDQIALVLAMARAVSGHADLQGNVQFDWPPHYNQQFDLGPDAARASLAGFLERQLEQRGCRGIVLLGEGHTALVPGERFPAQRLVRTASSADMLADHRVKRRVWLDLQPLVTRS